MFNLYYLLFSVCILIRMLCSVFRPKNREAQRNERLIRNALGISEETTGIENRIGSSPPPVLSYGTDPNVGFYVSDGTTRTNSGVSGRLNIGVQVNPSISDLIANVMSNDIRNRSQIEDSFFIGNIIVNTANPGFQIIDERAMCCINKSKSRAGKPKIFVLGEPSRRYVNYVNETPRFFDISMVSANIRDGRPPQPDPPTRVGRW